MFTEGKFIQEISKLSENVRFRRQWKELAEKCAVTLTSKYEDYYNPFFLSVENRKYAFNLDRCSFRRITRVPFSDQEKCLAILSMWMKGMTSKSGVTSLVQLLKDFNLPFLPGELCWTEHGSNTMYMYHVSSILKGVKIRKENLFIFIIIIFQKYRYKPSFSEVLCENRFFWINLKGYMVSLRSSE